MILKECTIDNFGKFTDRKFSFTAGLNSFDEDNGWGKTTLAAFIKAMFYGMTETRSKTLFIDREKYMPWQGGTFGGALVFSHGGREYKVIRSFGTKKKDDSFVLYDVKTGRESRDYTENLGEELFTVDLETFERSVFVTLDDSKKPQGSTDITAKLNNLIEDADDISNYDNARDRLEKLAAGIKAKRGPGGSLANLAAAVERDNNALLDIGSKERAVGVYQEKITDGKGAVEVLRRKVEELHGLFSLSEKYARKQNYDRMKEQEQAAAAKQEQLLAFFHGQVPDAGMTEAVSKTAGEYTKYANFLHRDPVTGTDRTEYQTLLNFFTGDVPSAEAVAGCQRDCDGYDVLKQQISEKKLSPAETDELFALKRKFGGKDISAKTADGYLSDYEKVQEFGKQIGEIESSLRAANDELEQLKQQKPRNIKRIVFFCIAAVFAAGAAGGILVAKSMAAGIAGFTAAAVCLVLGFIQKTVRPDCTEQEQKVVALENEAAEKKKESEKLEDGYRSFITAMNGGTSAVSVTVALSDIKNDFARYVTLKGKEDSYLAWKGTLPVQPEEYEKRIRAFEIRYGQKDDISAISSVLEAVRSRVGKLTELEKRIKEYDSNKQKLEECEEKLIRDLSVYETDKTAPYEKQVQEIRDGKHDYEAAVSDMNAIRKKIGEFEAQNDISLLKDAVKPEKDAETLKAELEKAQAEMDSRLASIAADRKSMDDLLSFTDRRQELESDLERCTADREKQEKQFDILTKTMQYLEEAKQKLDSNYMDPMKSGFAKYIGMLDRRLSFEISSDLTVSVENNGKPYDSRYLSEGYKDLVNFCSRMALIDALFRDEKPVVILDDPFVNLDTEKLDRALSLVRQMAEEKQILYFVCHKSRNAPAAV